AADGTKSSSTGYVEALDSTARHTVLWNNTGSDALRWPAGWHRTEVVDAIVGCSNGGYADGPAYGGTYACSYHVVDPSSGKRVATVCEGPSSPPTGKWANYSPHGLPTRVGVACFEGEGDQFSCNATNTWSRADWDGSEQDFLTTTISEPACSGGGAPVFNCSVSDDGTVMACTDNTSQATTLLLSNGTRQSLGRKYNVLGWIDGNHFLVEVDASTLGVVTSPGGTLARVSLDHADQVGMISSLPGSL
ncbi:MAG TPA: hypothetical protein VJU79_05230, partial [Candidatus Dormibacteraeota bacterium]|nr:hypothetical protein [Candidatus Dormibacteraeota bacterium]